MTVPKSRPPMSLDGVERRLAAADWLLLDLETSGVDWKRDYVCGWVLGFGPTLEDTTYLPVRHQGGANLDPKKVAACVKSGIRKNSKIRLKGFSLGFDLKFASREGIDLNWFRDFEDGQINAFLLNEYQRSFSLDACAVAVGATPKRGEELYARLADKFGGKPDRNQMKNFHMLAGDDPWAVDYAEGDSVSTWDTIVRQRPRLEEEDLLRVWDVECRCIPALTRMELLGVKVDEERLVQVRDIVARQTEVARAKLPRDFNSRAPTQMVKLFTDHGMKDEWPRTAPSKTKPDGSPSFPEEWLLKSDIGRAVVAVRKLENLESSFLAPLADHHMWHGRVHTTFNQTRGEDFGTVTGRLSSSNPNMQQVHKRNELLGSLFRSIFIPDDGMILSEADLSQAEPRLLAHYGEVKLLIDGYLSDPPIDAHSMVAKGAGIPRQPAKQLNQALITGAGDRKAASMLGLPMDEAMKIVNAYFRAMPEIKTFQRTATGVFSRRGYLKSMLGRRMRLDDPRFAYKGVNRILQTGNADILKLSLARIDEMLQERKSSTRVLLNVHDSIVFQFPETDRATYNDALDLMRDFGPGKFIEMTVPMEIEVGEGSNWAEATYGKETVRAMFKNVGSRYV